MIFIFVSITYSLICPLIFPKLTPPFYFYNASPIMAVAPRVFLHFWKVQVKLWKKIKSTVTVVRMDSETADLCGLIAVQVLTIELEVELEASPGIHPCRPFQTKNTTHFINIMWCCVRCQTHASSCCCQESNRSSGAWLDIWKPMHVTINHNDIDKDNTRYFATVIGSRK
jgi:hypothetical protein